ncbi:DUF115 domain-containing protein [Motilimonas cestriensis]|uniref:DUF115 domain-containing protein n=1 Tax=Motilimonas cestriensis TaxID=2742685 RepID=A0ABS8WDG3_9GAMM|nr:6-hydroxymethylpterin diphosphokinase MptE-like protein [Motilimonas cestriensis]MCE2595594.1 DUF115 domain-containing protein [Motilimonas cestriensis]
MEQTVHVSIEEKIAQIKYQAPDYHARFQKNIAAFADYIPDIAKCFEHYQPTNFEVALTKSSVDLVNIHNDELLFQGDAYRAALMDFEYFRELPEISNFTIAQNAWNPAKFIHVDQLFKLTELEKDHWQRVGKQRNPLPESFGLLICFGLGTGFFLEPLMADHKAKRIYIYEPNQDFFYSSLYLIDWASILKQLDEQGSSIHLCLGGNENEFFSDLGNELFVKGRYDLSLSFLYKHYQSVEIDKAFKLFQQKSYSLVYGFGFFDDALIAVSHFYHLLEQGVSCIEKKSPIEDNVNIPVFICANGPSLDKNIALIKKFNSQIIVVSCGTALRALLKNDIVPDFHIEQERTATTYGIVSALPHDVLKQINFLGSSILSPDVPSLFKRSMFSLKVDEPSTILANQVGGEAAKIHQMLFSNPTVTNCALSVLHAVGFRTFYFVGTDLGFPKGQHHSKDSIYYDQEGKEKGLFNIKNKTSITVPGNFGGEVETSNVFGYSMESLSGFIRLAGDVRCYNLSDGAYIHGANPMRAENVYFEPVALDKQQLIDNIYEYYSLAPEGIAQAIKTKLDTLDFESFVDDVIAYTEVEVNDRFEAITNMYSQFSYVVAGGRDKNIYFRDMMRGSLLYTHTLISRMLISAEDQDDGLESYKKGMKIVAEYMRKAKAKYKEELLSVDQTPVHELWRK